MGMGELNLENLSMSEQAEHEQVMISAGKKLSTVLERNVSTPDVIVVATEKAMKYVSEGGIPAGETPDSDTAEIYEVMNEVAELYKINGREIDPRKIVEELLLGLPTKSGSPGVAKQQILQAVQSVTGALSEFDVKEPPLDSDGPVVPGKPYSQELLEQSTQKPKAATIKPHGWSTTNAIVLTSIVALGVGAATVLYGFTSIDTKRIIAGAQELIKSGQDRGLVPSQNEATADKGRSKELWDLFAKDPYQIITEDGWSQLFERVNEKDEGVILVKYKEPNWWTKLLDKYPTSGNTANDNLIENHRQFALEAIRKALKEKSVSDLQKYKDNPNMVWTRLKDAGFSPENYTLYRMQINPDKNDFKELEYWQNKQYDNINSRPEQRDWKTPIAFLDNRPESQARLSTAMFLGTFAAYPGLLDEIRGMIGNNDAITVGQAQGILNNPNVRSKLSRRQFLKLAALIAGSAVLRSVGF